MNDQISIDGTKYDCVLLDIFDFNIYTDKKGLNKLVMLDYKNKQVPITYKRADNCVISHNCIIQMQSNMVSRESSTGKTKAMASIKLEMVTR